MPSWKWGSGRHRVRFKDELIKKHLPREPTSTQSAGASSVSVARKKCGSGHWAKNIRSWNVVISDELDQYRVFAEAKHIESPFDACMHSWHPENKYLAYGSSVSPPVPWYFFSSFPSTPNSAAINSETIRGGTKVFLFHCVLNAIHSRLIVLVDLGERTQVLWIRWIPLPSHHSVWARGLNWGKTKIQMMGVGKVFSGRRRLKECDRGP